MAQKHPWRTESTERGLPTLHPHAAGIDIAAEFHVVAVAADHDEQPVRTFKSFTNDLIRLADWLDECGITTVAMESTSVYWIPVYEILEEHGFEVILVNARDSRNVPGRKSDVNDAQWLQQLHQYGLLRGSFRPTQQIVTLRSYLRQRESLVQAAASHIQHMQKALDQMNVQLHHVVSDITGVTGMKILHAIVAGERDPRVLAEHRDARCKSSVETIVEALVGNYRAEHVFALRQAIDLHAYYHRLIIECDEQIEHVLTELRPTEDPSQAAPTADLPPARTKRHTPRNNEPTFDVRQALYRILGIDLTQIHGIGSTIALRLVGECGIDMSRWPTAKHFTSWLGLAPANKVSGGRVLRSATRPTASRAAWLLRLAAVTIGKTDTALGAFYRRLSARIGKAKAVTATARKIAVLFYNTLRYGMKYADPGASYYEQRHRQRTIASLRRRAEALGFTLHEHIQLSLEAGVS